MQIFTSEMQYSSSIRLGNIAVKVYLGLPLYQTYLQGAQQQSYTGFGGVFILLYCPDVS